MALVSIDVTPTVGKLPARVAKFVRAADHRIDAFGANRVKRPLDSFMPSELEGAWRMLDAIGRGKLVRGRAFCEWGCGFAAGDDVMILETPGRFAIAAIRQVVLPLDLELSGPLAESWRAGASVSSIVAHAYGLRPDPVTGLGQLVRSLAAGPASPVIDFVTRFDIDWHAAGPAPMLRLAPDGTEEDATAGPRPPMPGAVSETAWPAGENCAYARDAAGAPVWRAGAGPASLAAFSDGPWCPSAGAPSRWDVDLARVARVTVTLGVAVASARLRTPMSVLHGVGGGSRVVPDLIVVTDLIPGRRNGGQ